MTYLKTRLDALGATPESYTISIRREGFRSEYPLFSETKEGDIQINYVAPDGRVMDYEAGHNKIRAYTRIRYKPENVVDGKKYHTPPGAGIRFFYPPNMINRQDSCRTIVVTEGEFKAFAASLHGVPAVAVQGIHNTREKDKFGASHLPVEFRDFCDKYFVKNIIFLFDSDAQDIRFSGEKDEDKDITFRLLNFYWAIRNFREAAKELNVDVYQSIQKKDWGVKGLDDLFEAAPDNAEDIAESVLTLTDNAYFETKNVSQDSVTALEKSWALDSAKNFYAKYQGVLRGNAFMFKGSKYELQEDPKNPEKTILVCIQATPALDYLRIGTDYYKIVDKVDTDLPGHFIKDLSDWSKVTILDDHRKEFKNILQMIPKYDGNCNVPSHTDYKPVIGKMYNRYQPPIVVPAQGDWPITEKLIRHIFGEQYEMGLDYVQLLYLKPMQHLPVLCLVSTENNTGKTTFCHALKQWFGPNIVNISPADLESQFNDFYAKSLVSYMDEAFIDKAVIKEKIKDISTKREILVNAKGVRRYTVNCYIKFILLTNNADGFINLNDDDVRFWIRQVPILTKDTEIIDIIDSIRQEAPAFLHHLSTRTLANPRKESRMWFSHESIRTEAFYKVVAESRNPVTVAIVEMVKQMFFIFGKQEILLCPSNIFTYLQNRGYRLFSLKQITNALKTDLKMIPSKKTVYYKLNMDFIEGKVRDDNGNVEAYRGNVYTFRASDFIDLGFLTPEDMPHIGGEMLPVHANGEDFFAPF